MTEGQRGRVGAGGSRRKVGRGREGEGKREGRRGRGEGAFLGSRLGVSVAGAG